MGLFDDILKKPTPAPVDPLAGTTSGQGSGQPPQDDSTAPVVIAESAIAPKFVIEKSAETTIFGQDTETRSVNEENKTISEPTIHAEEAGNSLLVSTGESPLVSPAIEMIPAAESTPREFVLTPETIGSPAPEEVFTNTGSSDLFAHLAETPISGVDSVEKTMEASASEDNLFGDEPKTEVAAPAFTNPQEFIQKSLESIDTMIGKIDEKHEAKITEAEGYGKERGRYTELEKNAYEEGESLEKEKAHAIHMREILEKELDTTPTQNQEQPSSTEENLAGETLSSLTKESSNRGGGLSKVKEASKKEEDIESLIGL